MQRVLCLLLCAADEQARLASLRSQLGTVEQEKAGEMEARMQGLHDLSTALQVCKPSQN